MTRKQKNKKGDEMSKNGRVRSIQFNYEEDPDLLDLVNENVILKKAKSARPVLRDIFIRALRQEIAHLQSEQRLTA